MGSQPLPFLKAPQNQKSLTPAADHTFSLCKFSSKTFFIPPPFTPHVDQIQNAGPRLSNDRTDRPGDPPRALLRSLRGPDVSVDPLPDNGVDPAEGRHAPRAPSPPHGDLRPRPGGEGRRDLRIRRI